MGRRRTRITQEDLGTVIRPARRRVELRRSGGAGAVLLLLVLLVGGLIAGGITTLLHGRGGPSNADVSAPARRAVIFLLDGVTPAAMQSARLPNIRALAQAGTTYRNAWIGQLESVGPASGATIGTGSFPRTHGVIGEVWRDPATSRAVRPAQTGQVLLGSLEQVMESHHSVPMAAVLKDRSPAAGILAVGGTDCATTDAAATWLADYVTCISRQGRVWAPVSVAGHALPAATVSWSQPVATGKALAPQVEGWNLGAQDDRVAQTAVDAIVRTRPVLTIVDFPEYAQVVPFAPAASLQATQTAILEGIDRDIGLILSSLRHHGMLDRTVFVITAPTAVTDIRRSVPRSALRDAVVAAGGVPTYIDARASADIGVSDPLQAQPVAQALQAERLAAVDAIYFRIGARGFRKYQPQYLNPLLPANFADAMRYLTDTVASEAGPDVIAAYAPYAASRPPSADARQGTGAIGGVQWDSQHIPLILSGQGIGQGRSDFPARLVDIAPTLESLYGLVPTHVDGVVLADAFRRPSAGAADTQKGLARTLLPLIRLLQNRTAAASQ